MTKDSSTKSFGEFMYGREKDILDKSFIYEEGAGSIPVAGAKISTLIEANQRRAQRHKALRHSLIPPHSAFERLHSP